MPVEQLKLKAQASGFGKKETELKISSFKINDDGSCNCITCYCDKKINKTIKRGDVFDLLNVAYTFSLDSFDEPTCPRCVVIEDAEPKNGVVTFSFTPRLCNSLPYRNIDRKIECGMRIYFLPCHIKKFKYGNE